MAGFLKALVLLPVAVVVLLLAVANRGLVTLSFDPFSGSAPEFSLTLPLFAVLFGAVALGILVGGIGTWIGQGGHRRARRRSAREVRRLRADLDRQRGTGAPPSVIGAPGLPAPR